MYDVVVCWSWRRTSNQEVAGSSRLTLSRTDYEQVVHTQCAAVNNQYDLVLTKGRG